MRLSVNKPDALLRVGEMMGRQVSHMVHLIDDLIDIARITSGKVQLDILPGRVKNVLLTAVEISTPIIEAAQHDLSVDVEDDDFVIGCDQVRMAQVVGNLLTNAAKYTPIGGRIQLAAAKSGSNVKISVADNGVGIPADALPHVFDMFSQVSHHLDRSQGGLGIGVSIARQLVELHGGELTVTSEDEGKGSRFEITLPLTGAKCSEDAANTSENEADQGDPDRSLDILVADDNINAAVSLASLLDLRGHHVLVAHDGLSALRLASETAPHIIFLDIGMPGMTGHEVARSIREQDAGKNTMLVAVTGWGSREDLAHAQEAGFHHHLTKPAQFSDVDKLQATRLLRTLLRSTPRRGRGTPPSLR